MDVDALQPADLNGKIQGDFDNGKANQGLGPEEPNKIGLVDGLNGTKNGPSVVEADPVPDGNFPKNAVDEWPAPKQIHSFYIVRFRSYEDPQLRAKIELADKELQKKNQARFQLTEAIKAKKSDRAEIISQLKPLTAEDKRYRMIVGEKRKDMEPLQVALGKMRTANNAVREKGVGLCSSEEELNEIIQSLHYRMQHESNTLAVEKQLLKEIKQLEGTREKVIANAAMKAKLQDTFGQREAIQDELKHIGGDLDGVRREQLTVRTKIRQLEEQLKAIEAEINELQLKLTAENEKRNIAFESLITLRKKREEGNACYYENRSLLNMAKEHAAKKDVTALEELSHLEVEKFMSSWSKDKAFRDDYERRILPSLDSRQLSRDGRMRNPDEKPLASQLSTTVESQTVPLQANAKKTKEDATTRLEQDTAHKEGTNKLKEAEKKEKLDEAGDASDYVVPEKVQKEPAATNMIDAAKLREIKREEEIAKAKSALERKKRLAEKAAAKAAIRAQKEAEKKLKDREKKAKKKAGSSDPGIEAEVVEPEDAEVLESEKAEAVDEAPVTKKVKEQKVNIRQRNRPRAQDALPKVIHRRKKSPSYWVWAIPVASLLVVILAGLAYYYFL